MDTFYTIFFYITIPYFTVTALFTPIYSFCFMIFLLFYHSKLYQIFGGTFLVSHLPLIYGSYVCLVLFLKNRNGIYSSLNITILMSAFLFIASISSFFSVNPHISLIALINSLKVCVFAFLVSYFIRDFKFITAILLTFFIIGFLGSCEGIYFLLFKNATSFAESRFATLRGDANDTAMVLISTIPISFLFYSILTNRILKFFMLVSCFIITLGVISTFSRGGFISLCFVWLLLSAKSINSFKSIFLIVVIFAAIIIILPNSYYDRIGTLSQPVDSSGENSLSGRWELLKTGLNMFISNPLFGVGLECPKIMLSEYGTVKGIHALHNLYLEIAAGGGLFLLLSFLAIIFVVIKNYIHTYLKNRSDQKSLSEMGYYLGISFFGMCISGFFLSQERNPIIWLLIGLSGSLLNCSTGFKISKIKKHDGYFY